MQNQCFGTFKLKLIINILHQKPLVLSPCPVKKIDASSWRIAKNLHKQIEKKKCFNMPFGLVCQNVLDTEQINAASVERVESIFLKIIIFLYTYTSIIV